MRSCVLFLFAAVAFGQSTANIVGTVRDSTEAAVPGARVTAVNVQTGLRLTRESSGDGSYSIPLVPAGQYRLEVEKDGFQRYARSGITLAVGDNATLDVALAVGSLAESVTVTSAAPLLETQTGTIRGLVDQQRIVDLPLNGRQITNLMHIQAGVIQRSGGTSEGDAFVVNGSRQSGVYFTLDGGMNTDSYRNYSGVFPEPRRGAGVQRSEKQLQRGVRQRHRRGGERGHQVRHQRIPRLGVRVSAQRRLQCPQLLRRPPRLAEALPVRRHRRRARC